MIGVPENSRRSTLAMLPLGAFETAADGTWEFVSPALTQLLGDLPASSLLGREWLKRVHPEDLNRVVSEYRQARDFGRPWRQDFRMHAMDGSIVHVEVDATPLPHDPTATGVGYVGLVKDRSGVVIALNQANESLELVEAMLEAVHEGVIINRVDVTIAANTAAARILGYDDPSELVGMTGSQRLHPDDYKRMMPFAQSRDTTFTVVGFLRKDGSVVQVAVHGHPVMFAGAEARLVTFVPVDDPLVDVAVARRGNSRRSAGS